MQYVGNTLPFLILFIATIWVYRTIRLLRAVPGFPWVGAVSDRAEPSQAPLVTVIVPARNEEDNIRACIESLRQQDYARLQILVINDHSTDGTEAILQAMQIPCLPPDAMIPAASTHCSRIAYMNTPTTTPIGWTGKNFAIHSAIPLAAGSWLLFTDADTRHEPHGLDAALCHAQKHRLRLLTLLPRYIKGNLFDNLITPFAMCYLAYWFSIDRVNDPRSRAYFANGQFLLIERDLYREIGGHECVRGDFLEDFEIMKRAKAQKAPLQCAFGTTVYGTRMYNSMEQNWRGWRRICLHAFARNSWVILFKAAELLCASILPFLLFIPLTYLVFTDPQLYGTTWAFALLLQGYILVTSWQLGALLQMERVFLTLFHPIQALGLLAILLDAGYHAFANRQTSWR